jgi:O-antigen/teichoic acid export membrane protein
VPHFFLNLFGKDYLLGAVPLVILGFGQLFNVFVGPVGNALNMANSERVVFRVSALTLVLNLGLNALLIPYFGLIGAAVATVSSLVLWNIILAIQLKIKHGVNVSII